MASNLGEACTAIARAVADSLDLSEVIGRVADAARLVVPFDAMGVWHATAPDGPLSLIPGPGASGGVAPPDRPLRRSDHSSRLWPDSEALPACIADAPAELDRAFAGDRIVIELGFRSALVLGLASGARSLGILWFLKREAGAYAPSHAVVLQPVVDLTTLAVEHTQLQSLSDERHRKRDALEALLPTLAGALDVQAVFAQVSEVIQSVIPHDHMTLGLASSEGKGIRFHASSRGTISPNVPEYRPRTDYGAESLSWDYFIVREYVRMPEGMLRVEYWDPRRPVGAQDAHLAPGRVRGLSLLLLPSGERVQRRRRRPHEEGIVPSAARASGARCSARPRRWRRPTRPS